MNLKKFFIINVSSFIKNLTKDMLNVAKRIITKMVELHIQPAVSHKAQLFVYPKFATV